jgi:chromosome partitioning protein
MRVNMVFAAGICNASFMKSKKTIDPKVEKVPHTLACVNLKGGVGKTTLAVNLAAYCGLKGLKTLLIDLDPQTNATFSCISVEQWQDHSAKFGTIASLFGIRGNTSAEGKVTSVTDVIKKNVFENVDLIPSHLELITIDLDLAASTAREFKLRKSVKPVMNNYDVIICDCPPNLTLPTQNALALCSHYLVPVSPDFLSTIGIGLLQSRVESICDDLETSLSLAGIVLSRVGRPAGHREGIVDGLRKTFGKDVLASELKERVAVSEAASKQQHVFAGNDQLAKDEYTAVAAEVFSRMGVDFEIA